MSGEGYLRVETFLARRYTTNREDEFGVRRPYRHSADPLDLEEFVTETAGLFNGIAEFNSQTAPSITGWWLGAEQGSIDIEEALHFFCFVRTERFDAVEQHFRKWIERLPFAFSIWHEVFTL